MLTYEHGSKKGVGSQLRVDIRKSNPMLSGCAILEIRNQTNDIDTARRGPKKWEFDDPNPAIAELSVTQVAHILAVLRGFTPCILGGKGLSVKEEGRMALVHLDAITNAETHIIDWYDLHIKTIWANGEVAEGRIRLNPTEASSLKDSLSGAMCAMAFG